MATAPEESLDADVKIIESTKARYPLQMQRQGIEHGEVRLMLEIDARGRLVDCLVTAFTQREFAREAMDAVKEWTFEPARIGGKAVTGIASIDFEFEYNGVNPIVRQFDTPVRRELHYDFAPCAARDLDRQPKPLWTVPPQYSKKLSDAGVTGKVVLEFFIDPMGKVRFPVAKESPDPRLSGLAIAAVKLWAFEPPTRLGLPVLARASTEFVFTPEG